MESNIKVTIPKSDIEAQGPSSAARGNMVVSRLAAAGIPVIGALVPLGVTSGFLIMSVDEFFGDHLYEWRATL